MPKLEWVGKSKVVNHHHDVPFRLLDRQYSFTAQEGTPSNSTNNKIIQGDNLEALKSLLPEFEGKVNCIYIDPPYNTGNEGWVYNDNVNDPKIKKWLGQVVGKEGEDLSRHDKWLCMMYPRLKLLHRLLADDGVIFVSLDDNEISSFRLIMDEIFGKGNFITTITWKSRAKPSNTGDAKLKPQNDSEYIAAYKKADYPRFNLIASGKERNYPHSDGDGSYRLQTILKSNRGESKRGTMQFSLHGYKPPSTKRWQAGEKTILDLFNRNRITFETGEPMLKYYEHEEAEEFSPFYCHVPKELSGTAEGGKKELNAILGIEHGFDTVKPLEILNYILSRVLVKKGAIFLDSFAGSGSTAHAVLKLNAQDGGNRRFILCEMMDYAETITAERVRRVMNGYGQGNKAVLGTGGGFEFFKVGKHLFKEDKNLNEEVGTEAIRGYVAYTERVSPEKCLSTQNPISPYALGITDTALYIFYYEKDRVTTLDIDFLGQLKIKHLPSRPEQFVIYADKCALDKDFLYKHAITFKRIPRDITRF
ncbi:MAG: hypothetical protein RLZZ352_2404 [Pseudomonadota bacterium]|jgi:adenine-specific DNA-methyltransferase